MSAEVHPYDSSLIPDLRILPLDVLVEHEYNDDQRTLPLAKRLEAEGVLKNPPIVTPLDQEDSRFVVLDGANRVTALSMLGYPHILVQVVAYEPPQVTLSTWHHVVSGLEPNAFIAALTAVEGVDFFATDLLQARAGLARREFLMYVIGADGWVFAARPQQPQRSIHEQNRLLNALVDTYRQRCRLHRAMTESLDEAWRLYAPLTAIVIFPQYEPAEVLILARDGELLPAGLTRHLIQGRALRVNYPLSELGAPDSLEEKNARLRTWLRRKLTSKEVRFYGEATFLFDE